MVIGLSIVILLGVYADDLATRLQFVARFERLGANEHGCLEYRHRQTGIVFVKVPGVAGRFGSHFGAGNDEVTLEPFLIARRQLRRCEWWRAMTDDRPPIDEEDFDFPQHMYGIVSKHLSYRQLTQSGWGHFDVDRLWPEHRTFCERTGMSLPTRAEWSYVFTSCVVDYDRFVVAPKPLGVEFPVEATETVDQYGERVIRGPAATLREWVEDGFVSTEFAITGAGSGRSVNLRPVYRGLP